MTRPLLPSTPAGERLRLFLDRFNTGEAASRRGMITEFFREEPWSAPETMTAGRI